MYTSVYRRFKYFYQFVIIFSNVTLFFLQLQLTAYLQLQLMFLLYLQAAFYQGNDVTQVVLFQIPYDTVNIPSETKPISSSNSCLLNAPQHC